MVRTITLDDYLNETCGTMPSGIAFNRATASMSGSALKRAKERLVDELQAWQERRDKARDAYAALVESGEIVTPTGEQILEQIASGNLESERVQAAIRVLEKRQRRMEAISVSI